MVPGKGESEGEREVMAEEKNGLPVVPFASRAVWESWLEASHKTSPGLWLKLAKKESGIESVSYPEAVEVALCFGWIDGQKGSWDGEWWVQHFVPRRPRSKWSKINCGHAERLIAAGRMRAAGLAEVERAKADGRWEAAYHSQRTMPVPDDLLAALDAEPAAAAFWPNVSGANRYAILYRIHDAKRPETRAKRIAQFVAMLAKGEMLNA